MYQNKDIGCGKLLNVKIGVRRAVESIRVTKERNLIISIKGGVEVIEPLYLKKVG